jgi:hypothetical protein
VTESLEPLVRVQAELTPPNGRTYWSPKQKVGESPTYTLGIVANTFFGRTKRWLKKMYHDFPDLDIAPRDDRGFRQFHLYDVELTAHLFLQYGIIDLRRFRNVILIIRGTGGHHRLI